MSDGISDGDFARSLADEIINEGEAWIAERKLADIGERVRLAEASNLRLTARIAELEKRLTWQPIDETTPRNAPIIVAVMNTYSQTWTVGEAYWNDTDNDWWWANVSPGDYAGDSILNMNGPVEFWQPMPVAPVARTTLEASERGGGE